MEMLRNADREAIKTLIGVILIKLATGIIGIWGSTNIYFISYLRDHGNNVSASTNSLIIIFSVIPLGVVVLFSTKISKIFGYKRVVKICAFVFMISPLLINFKLNLLTLTLFCLFLPATSFSISAIPVINCLWTQFSADRNKATALAVVFFSAGSIIWNLVFMALINPDNRIALIDDNGVAYFSSNVTAYLFQAANPVYFCGGLLFVIGSFLIEKRSKPEQEEKPMVEEQPQLDVISEVENELNILEKTKSPTLLTSLKDIKFVLIFICCLLMALYPVYVGTNLKILYMPLVNDDHFLGLCMVGNTVAAMFGAPLWGHLADANGFKIIFIIIAVIDTLTKLFGLFAESKMSIALLLILLGFVDKGMVTIVGPGLVEMFGLEMATELLPYKGLAIFAAFMLVPAIQLICTKHISNKDQLIIFFIAGVIALICATYFNFNVDYDRFSKLIKKEQIQELKDMTGNIEKKTTIESKDKETNKCKPEQKNSEDRLEQQN